MVRAQRALVRPRVRAGAGGHTLLLEEEVARLLESGARGLVALVGPAGAGKTTALRHLAAVLPPDPHLLLLDDPDGPAAMTAPVRLVVYAARSEQPIPHLASYRLADWGPDDLIEYLLAAHRPRCAVVMARVHERDRRLLGGAPELWRVVLDRLAEDAAIPDARRALHRHLGALLCDTDLLGRARSACLNAAVASGTEGLTAELAGLARPGFAEELVRVLRHPAVQVLLAAERVAAELHGEGDCDWLAARLPRDLVGSAATLLRDDARALERLRRLLAGLPWGHAMAASLLHAAGTGWAPAPGSACALAGAYLDGARWPGVDLTCADLRETDLSAADLSGATLTRANASRADLSRARLHAAALDRVTAAGADLTGADLSGARAAGGRFSGARLAGADLDGAALRGASFAGADLTGATLRGADLSHARFVSSWGPHMPPGTEALSEMPPGPTKLEGADFSGADLTAADLSGLCLRTAVWRGARFTQAKLRRCDLEYLDLPDADFAGADLWGALLTGTTMPGARFRRADLREAGLADVDWEGSDLRRADLRRCSFHLGSTRSGLVGSPIACEGSKTGFYTDEYDEQSYKAPEEIRKANLRGADLRGARLDGVDFYLVDVRGAALDADQELHLRRCGAILATRV
jgi:uncharacterized protein YjbI with pentapeptide repeats/energy-coupling factor transporter ATP-binding protein EcfA2